MSKLTDWMRGASSDDLIAVIAGERPAGMPPRNGGSMAEADANANLIAAAPDLLAALEGLVAVVGKDDWRCIEAKEAIAKAKGEAE